MTRSVSNLIWSLGLFVGAIVLAKKAEDPLPWAIGTLAAIVFVGAALGAVVENDRNITAAHKAAKPSTTGTPGATGTQ